MTSFQVAKIAQETMNGYRLLEKRLFVEVLPMKKARRAFKVPPRKNKAKLPGPFESDIKKQKRVNILNYNNVKTRTIIFLTNFNSEKPSAEPNCISPLC